MMRSLLLVIGVLAWPVLARADDPKLEAKQHVEKATELHKQGELAAALDELKTAYVLDPQPQLLFAMGQIHVQLGQCTQAITYYTRFLSTKPSAELEAVTREAIQACKTNPPPAVDSGKHDVTPTPEPTPPPPPVAAPEHPTPVAPGAHHASWYADHLGDALVVVGIASGVAGGYFYSSARSERSAADSAASYQDFVTSIDHAHTKQTEAIVFGAAAAALVTIGAEHIVLHHGDGDVAIVPGGGGGSVVWAGRF